MLIPEVAIRSLSDIQIDEFHLLCICEDCSQVEECCRLIYTVWHLMLCQMIIIK